MTNVSKNSLDLIETTAKRLKGKFGKAFLATLIMIAPLMACVFSLYLIPVAVLLFGVLQTGYIRYIRDLIDDKQPSLKVVFSEFSNPGLEILLGTILICMFALGSILLIVPAIILVAFYSMSFYFAENKKSNSPLDAMKHSRQHMKGNYTNMYSFKVLYWLIYVLLIVLGLAGVIIAVKLWTSNYIALAIVVFAVDFIFTTLVWSLVSTYYNTSCELFFRELLVYNGEVKEETPVNIVEEPVELKVEDNKTAESKPVRKTTKSTTKKTTATKTTAAKTTAAKTTGTKATVKKTAPKTASKSTSTKTTKSTKSTTTKKTTNK